MHLPREAEGVRCGGHSREQRRTEGSLSLRHHRSKACIARSALPTIGIPYRGTTLYRYYYELYFQTHPDYTRHLLDRARLLYCAPYTLFLLSLLSYIFSTTLNYYTGLKFMSKKHLYGPHSRH